MKLLFIITELNIGGAERILLRLTPLLLAKYQVTVITLQGGTLISHLQAKGVEVIDIKLYSPSDIIRSILQFRDVVSTSKPDVLFTHLAHADMFGRILGKLFGIPKIYAAIHNCYTEKRVIFWLEKYTSFLIEKYLPVSESVKRFLVSSWKIQEEKILVVPNFIDPTEFESSNTEDTELRNYLSGLKSNGTRIITSLSSLNPHKRVEDLINAFHRYSLTHKENNDIVLIFNDGLLRENIQSLITSHHLEEKTKLMGQTSDIKAIYEYSDVVSLNSEHEGMSSILQESMFYKKQIIATDVPENREVLEGYKGVQFYSVGDIKALAQLLEYGYENEIDFAFPERYTAQAVVKQFDTLIEKL